MRLLKFFVFGAVLVLIGFWFFRQYPSHLQPDRQEKFQPKVSSDGSRTQVYIHNGDALVQVSSGSANSRSAFRRGDFVVWVEAPQDRSEKYIVRYHIPTATTLKITEAGVGQHPRVNTQGTVVWQQWVDDGWQIFVYDGFASSQVTDGTQSAVHPDIFADRVVFARKNRDGEWNVEEIQLPDGKPSVVPSSTGEKYPIYQHDQVLFANAEQAESNR